ncbi:hypothetical protein FJZ23_02225 [Candidatus Parcubacteria bacterium]|nr:hypothetical protein [Candidatus Parcubacteria bacterium]
MFRLDHLPNARPNETVVLFIRRHWICVFAIAVAFLFLTAVPLALAWFFWPVVSVWFAHPTFGPLMILGASIYFLSIWLFASIEFTDYYLDTWIVTNERIINIEQEGLFHRTASELDLAAVQDTTAEIRGIVQTVLSYGNVFVQTAGEQRRFHFKKIHHPERIKEIITRLVEEDKQRLSGHGKIKTVIK